jgi:chemotaxis protein MotB
MMKRRRQEDEEHENHERWLVSYADFITLLFAFFVVMYAISSVNEGKYKVLSNALGAVFSVDGKTPVSGGSGVLSGGGAPIDRMSAERRRLGLIAKNLMRLLAPLIRQGAVRVTQSTEGISVEINASVLFKSGKAVISNDATAILMRVASLLGPENNEIQIEGHTDAVSISNVIYPSNWELSASRAASVARLLIDGGVRDTRVTIVGHAATRPKTIEVTDDDRAKNRRVVIWIRAGAGA